MASTILVLNGPNLNMLGIREPEIYGRQTLEDIRVLCEQCASSVSLKTEFKQSNRESQLIDWIHETASRDISGIILNPAGYGHTSVALMDALNTIQIPVVEVHLSNIYTREEFRQHTYTSRVSKGVIAGFGSYSYLLAIYALNEIFKNLKQ